MKQIIATIVILLAITGIITVVEVKADGTDLRDTRWCRYEGDPPRLVEKISFDGNGDWTREIDLGLGLEDFAEGSIAFSNAPTPFTGVITLDGPAQGQGINGDFSINQGNLEMTSGGSTETFVACVE